MKELIIMSKQIKTNAMRILEREKIPFTMHSYPPDGEIDGVSVAHKIGIPEERVFKTLVTQGKSKNYYVFVIPVAEELDMKAAASAAGEKNVEMIHVKDLLAVTGYIRGGCSPIGMKKKFKTVVDSSAKNQETVYVSGGKIGFQIEIAPSELLKAADARYENIIK